MQNEEMNHSIGMIYGNPGVTDFNFTVKDNSLRKFDFVTAPHKEGFILAQVIDMKRYTDLKFDEAISIENEDDLRKIKNDVAAVANVIGFRDKKGLLQAPRTTFQAGKLVEKAPAELIREVVGLRSDPKNGAYIGLLKGIDLPIYLNVDSLVQKHICILAKTGGGKSYAGGVLVEELLKKKVPIVIIDTHGEYISLTAKNTSKKDKDAMGRFNVSPSEYSSQIRIYSPNSAQGDMKRLKFQGTNLEAREILDVLNAKLSGPQVGVLYQAVKEVKEYKDEYTIADIIEAVNRSKSNARWNVIASLQSLASTGLFAETATKTTDLVKPGKCSVINMKGVPPDVQEIIVARLTTVLFEERKLNKIPPFLLFVEEAHNYCPERGFGSTVSSGPLRTVASEGRKFGMGLCIVSQRPAKVDKNIVSQCNTNIILKVTNPNDLKAIVASVEGLTTQTANEIQRLPIGVALISGASIQMPIMAEIRTRETNHGGQSVKVFKDGKPTDFKPDAPTSPLVKDPVATKSPERPPQENMEEFTKQKQKGKSTEKALRVHRVANRLGWVSTDDAEVTIKKLSKEAEKMNENVYKYLNSLAGLGKKFCHEENPDCIHCPMNNGCGYRASARSSTKRSSGLFNR